MRAFPLLAVLIFAPLTDAIAQDLTLIRGQRVRVTAPDFGINKQEAALDALEGGVLVVIADSTMRYPLAAVTRLDVWLGQRSAARWGTLFGFVGGAAVGAVIGNSLGDSEGFCFFACTAEAKAAWGAGIGGGVGALSGLLIGALIKTDKWERVAVDRLRVSVTPRRDGFGIGASVAF